MGETIHTGDYDRHVPAHPIALVRRIGQSVLAFYPTQSLRRDSRLGRMTSTRDTTNKLGKYTATGANVKKLPDSGDSESIGGA